MIRKNNEYVDISSSSGMAGNTGYYGNNRNILQNNVHNITSNSDSYRRPAKSYNTAYNTASAGYINNKKNTTEKGNIKTKKSKKKNKILLIIIIVLEVLMLLGAGGYGVFMYYLGGLNTQPFTSDASALNIAPENDPIPNSSGDKITNIALFGIDTRNNDDDGRSDAILILSVDEKHSKIKMTSVLRDSLVYIDEYGNDKITHAYKYGGPELAVKTLNQNFGLDIREYATVNFNQMSELIDAIGGIDMDITEDERVEMNRIVKEMNVQVGTEGSVVDTTGLVHLDGVQATAYSRIRKIDSDNARADRQQKVLIAMFNQCKSMPKSNYPNFIKQLLPLVTTSLDYSDIIDLSSIMLKGDLSIEKNVVPDLELDNPWDEKYNGMWVYRYDLDAASDRLRNFIYESDTDGNSDDTNDEIEDSDY